MKKKTPANKRSKLSLTRSAIRKLDDERLREAVGGNDVFITDEGSC